MDMEDDTGSHISDKGRRRSNRTKTRLRSYSPTRSPPRPSKRRKVDPIPGPPKLTPEEPPPNPEVKARSPKKRYTCPSCPYTVITPSDLAKHVINHGKFKKFKCCECDYSADQNNSVKRHETVHKKYAMKVEVIEEAEDHPPPPPKRKKVVRRCSECPFKTPVADLFRTHQEGHKRVTGYKCPECSFRAQFYGILVKHIPLHNKEENPAEKGSSRKLKLLCSDCTFTSTNSERLETHRLGHDDQFKGVFECSTCFFQTLNWQEFDTHDKKHDEKECGVDSTLTPASPPRRRAPKRARSPIETKIIKGNKVFLCPKCPYYGKRATDLRKHVRHHGVTAVNHCPHCDYASNSQHAVSIHVKLHPQQEIKKCFDVAAPPTLIREKEKEKNMSKIYSCGSCPAKFYKKRLVLFHRKGHTLPRTGSRTCSCGYTATKRLNLTCHFVSAHKDRAYLCKKKSNLKRKCMHVSCFPCQIPFKYHGLFLLHKYYFHRRFLKMESERAWKKRKVLSLQMPTLTVMKSPLKCEQTAPKLVKHTKADLKECPECPYRTPQASELRKHVVRHSSNDPIKCADCTFTCCSTISLSHHKKVHRVNVPNGNDNSTSYFKCEHCPYTTRFPYDLGNHSKRHGGEGDFSCLYCTYKAQRKGHIRKHQLLHTDANAIHRAKGAKSSLAVPTAFEKQIVGKDGEIVGTLRSGDCYRVYNCVACPFRTPLNSSLIAHSRLHNGERIFKCTQCSFNTDVQRRLTDHIKVHNKNYTQAGPGDMGSAKTSAWAPRIRSPYSKSGCMYKCDYCPHTTKAYTALWYHLQKHKKSGKYSCKECSFATSSIACMRRHDLVHIHKEDGHIEKIEEQEEETVTNQERQSWQCPHCPFLSKSHGSYCHHLKMHRKKVGTCEHACPHCTFKTSAKSTFKRHLLLHQTPEMQFLLEQENTSTNTVKKNQISGTKMVRVHTVNKPENPLQCSECPHLAQSKQLLSIHKKMHKGRRPYKCPHCSFSVQHEASLKTHLLLHAPGVSGRHRSDRILSAVIRRAAANHLLTYSKKYPTCIPATSKSATRVQCPLCSYRTRNPDRLVQHHNEKHATEVKTEVVNGETWNGSHRSSPSAAPGPSNAEPRMGDGILFYCSKCSFRTEHQGNLVKHTSMHGAKDNTYMCSVCDYSCKQIRVVRFHEQNHHKYVPFTLLFSDKVSSGESEGNTRGYVNGVAEPRRKVPLHCTLCPFTTVGLDGLMRHWKEHEQNEEKAEEAKCNMFLAGLSLLPRPSLIKQ